MQTFIAKYKVREGMDRHVLEWAQFLNDRSEQVLESLQEEGVLFELAFLDTQADGLYLIYVFKANNLVETFKILEKSYREVDVFHRETFSKVFAKPKELQSLIDFENFAI